MKAAIDYAKPVSAVVYGTTLRADSRARRVEALLMGAVVLAGCVLAGLLFVAGLNVAEDHLIGPLHEVASR